MYGGFKAFGKNALEAKNQVTPSGKGLPPINAQVAINQTASNLRGIFPPSGAGDISYLPLPLNQGLKASTGSSGPNSTPPVVFSAHDSFSVATHVASAIFGIGS